MKKFKFFTCLTFAALTIASAFAGEWDIKVFRPAVNPRNKNDVMVKAKEAYIAKHPGAKVTLVLGDWGTVESKVLSNMAAGDPIDVVFVRDQDFPKFEVKGYLQPVDDYVDLNLKGYDGRSIFNKTAADNVFKYNGHYYAASHVTSNHCWILIYNKDLMDEMGIKESEQPAALYAAGKWDWNHLAALARKMTGDTSGSGSIDRWGLGNWYTRIFAYMNGVEFTKKQGNNMVLNFTDSRLVEALDFLQGAKTEGWYQQDNTIVSDGIANRTCAMVIGREYDVSSISMKTDDEICYVPLPHGPSVEASRPVFECDGYGIGAGSKKQVAAGEFINICLQEWYKDDMANRKKSWPEDVITLADKMLASDPYYPGPTVAALDSMLDKFLGEVVWSGNSAASAIEKWTPKATALLADANKPMGQIEYLKFSGIQQNFEKVKSNKLDSFVKLWDGTSTAKVSLVSGKEAIGGKGTSLLLQYDPATDGESAYVIITDPTALGIVGWKDYKISFDAQIVGKATSTNPQVYVQAYADELNQYGWTSKGLKEGETVTVSGSITEVLQNGRIGLAFGFSGATAVLIDNIVITEKEKN